MTDEEKEEPYDPDNYVNEKRHELYQLESRLASRIIIIPSDELTSPHFALKRLRSDELDEIAGTASFLQKMEIESREPDVMDRANGLLTIIGILFHSTCSGSPRIEDGMAVERGIVARAEPAPYPA